MTPFDDEQQGLWECKLSKSSLLQVAFGRDDSNWAQYEIHNSGNPLLSQEFVPGSWSIAVTDLCILFCGALWKGFGTVG